MPIDLSNLDFQEITGTEPDKITPKWFHNDLTGNGRGIGLVNQKLTPTNQPASPFNHLDWGHTHRKTEVDADHTLRVIPVGILPRTLMGDPWISHVGLDLLPIESRVPGVDVALGITPQTGAIHYVTNDSGRAYRQLSFLYRVELYVGASGTIPAAGEPIQAHWQVGGAHHISGATVYSTYAADEVRATIDNLLDRCPVPLQVDLNALEDWLTDYSLYDQLNWLAGLWSDPGSGAMLSAHINSLVPVNIDSAAAAARYLENYNLPLDAYAAINNQLVGGPVEQDHVRHQNLNLLMYSTLNDLVQAKDQLPTLPACTMQPLRNASPEQWAAITSTEPLNLVAAGAGSGKSTTILNRVEYLRLMGVDLAKVTVLSFTNAAAGNIKTRNPGVRSRTIDSLVLAVYEHNHPTHRVSAIDTICNALMIFPDDADRDVAFSSVLRQVDSSGRSKQRASAPMVDLAGFVTENLEWVLGRLDTIRQTSLELAKIVNYLTRGNLSIPTEVVTEYLIVDEVQDTSLFEFAYLMTFARAQRANMFMVGDPSQTLYEFRGADPRALMILAKNDDFAKFSLETNYRSNQQVLDFANVQLAGLESNQGLDIQLQSHQLGQGSEASFLDAVRLHPVLVRVERDFAKEVPALTLSVVKPYVEEALARGEQVAVIAPTRLVGTMIENRLKELFPAARIDNITSARRVANQVFSRFIRHQWDDVIAIGPTSASLAVIKLITANPQRYGPRFGDDQAKTKELTDFLGKWWSEQNAIINSMVSSTVAGTLTSAQFFDHLRDLLLQYEIKANAQAQMALQVRNQMRKQMPGEPNVVISTIHGVKGLEFDNVVVVNNEATNRDQAQKRMAYVALTRAKKTELVIAYRTTDFSPLKAAHQALATAYWRQDVFAAARANGIDVDLLSEDEVKSLLEADQPGRLENPADPDTAKGATAGREKVPA